MIIALILGFIASFLAMVFSILPSVGVADIPFIGGYIVTYVSLAMSYWNLALEVIPYFQIVWSTFLYVIIPFEFAMLVAKFFFGSRLPTNNK